jgi:urease accessory protein
MSDALRLALALQLGDSGFPGGMYTQSHGLELLIEEGLTGCAAFHEVIECYLLDAAATCEAVAARHVALAAADHDLTLVGAIDEALDLVRLPSEVRLASRRCGGRILELGMHLFPDDLRLARYRACVDAATSPGHQTVAMALLGSAAGLTADEIVVVELHNLTTSLISAAVRLGAIDYLLAQRLALACRPLIVAAAARGAALDWRAMHSSAPLLEIAQLRHATASSHLFVS